MVLKYQDFLTDPFLSVMLAFNALRVTPTSSEFMQETVSRFLVHFRRCKPLQVALQTPFAAAPHCLASVEDDNT